MALSTAVVAAGLALASLGGVDASGPEADRSITATSQYGVNEFGWQLIVVNDSPQPVTTSWGALSNIDFANPRIEAYSVDEATRGRESIFGGPANMDIQYSSFYGTVKLTVTTNWASTSANVGCNASGSFKCEVLSTALDKPLAIRLSPNYG